MEYSAYVWLCIAITLIGFIIQLFSIYNSKRKLLQELAHHYQMSKQHASS